MDHSFFLIVALVVGVMIVAGVAGYLQRERRRKELLLWSARRGLSFSIAHDPGLQGRYPFFDCLRKGDNRYGYHLMSGSLGGYDVQAFDYHYQTTTHTRHGSHTEHHHFSAMVVRSPVPLQPLKIRPENLLDKVANLVGIHDINFESDEFSRRFHV